jgi:lipopolysaccharide transport protein LptA
MALSCRSLLFLCGCALSAHALALAPTPAQQPISVDAASSEVDYKTHNLVFTQVVIAQGATRVQAEHAHATGLDFANSRWTFEGDVHIDAPQQGTLRSDAAVVEFRDNQIARATITGKPAQFEQKRSDSNQVARGHADEIVYDVAAGTVRLTSDAWLSNGQQEISGPMLVYNMREQKVQAATAPGTGERVHIVIGGHDAAKPDAAKPEASKADPTKPAPGSSPQP